MHALVNPGVAAASGIEIDKIKCNKAAAFLKHSVAELSKRINGKTVVVPKVQCSSIEKVQHFTFLHKHLNLRSPGIAAQREIGCRRAHAWILT